MTSHLDVPAEVPRRVPRQVRGERRVAELLVAAEAVIAEIGYEAATMSAIAERAGAAIGSLYQFFPNKSCITQALRAEYAKRFDRMCAPLAARATTLNPPTLAGHLIDLAVNFAETHPALPALLDAPGSTRAPSAIRRILQERFAGLALAQNPNLSKPEALRMGMVTLEMIRALNRLYMEVPPRERPALVREFKTALASYLKARSKSRTSFSLSGPERQGQAEACPTGPNVRSSVGHSECIVRNKAERIAR